MPAITAPVHVRIYAHEVSRSRYPLFPRPVLHVIHLDQRNRSCCQFGGWLNTNEAYKTSCWLTAVVTADRPDHHQSKRHQTAGVPGEWRGRRGHLRGGWVAACLLEQGESAGCLGIGVRDRRQTYLKMKKSVGLSQVSSTKIQNTRPTFIHLSLSLPTGPTHLAGGCSSGCARLPHHVWFLSVLGFRIPRPRCLLSISPLCRADMINTCRPSPHRQDRSQVEKTSPTLSPWHTANCVCATGTTRHSGIQ